VAILRKVSRQTGSISEGLAIKILSIFHEKSLRYSLPEATSLYYVCSQENN